MSQDDDESWPLAMGLREIRRLGRALPSRLKFTREGKIVVLITFALGFAAINSGNNLLYLMFGMMLSLIIISGVLSEMNLRRVRVRRIETHPIFVGQPALVCIEIHNRKKIFRSLSLEVEEIVGVARKGTQSIQRRGLVLMLGPGERTRTYVRIQATKRGQLPSAGVMLATKFPFGFFSKRRFFSVPHRFTVLPELEAVGGKRWLARSSGLDERLPGVGAGDEFHSLRDLRPGDDLRRLAWKASARRDRLVIRENERPATRRVVLAITNAVQDPSQEAPAFEAAIRRTASLARHFMDEGFAIGLASADGGVPVSADREQLTRIYHHLARLPLRRLNAGSSVELFRCPGAHEVIHVLTEAQLVCGLGGLGGREVLIQHPATEEDA